MNTRLFANPQLFQAYQSDPGLAYGQALMQQGASGAPVRSPLEGLARALTAGVGGFTQSKVRDRYQADDDRYRKGLTAALQGKDILASLQASEDPTLQQMALEAKVQRAMKDPAETFQTLSDAEEQALGLDTTGTYQRGNLSGKVDTLTAPVGKRKIGETRDFIQGDQKITQEWDGQKWAPLGQGRAYAPPSQVNVNTKTETEFNKAYGKGEGEAAAALANEIPAVAQAELNTLGALAQAYSELQAAGGDTGLMAGVQTKTTQIMQALGMDPKALGLPESAGPAEQIQAITNRLAMEARNPAGGGGLPGAASDADREFLKQTVPNLGNTPQGFQAKLEIAQKIAERKLQMANEWASGKYEQSQEGFRKFKQDWNAYTKANPLFKAESAPKSETSSRPSGMPEFSNPNDPGLAKLPSGAAFYAINPDGTKTLRYKP